MTTEKKLFVGDYALKDVIATLEFINTFHAAQGFEAYIDDCYLVVKREVQPLINNIKRQRRNTIEGSAETVGFADGDSK